MIDVETPPAAPVAPAPRKGIPYRIHQTARTKQLSWEERRLLAGNRRLQSGWSYSLWDDQDNRALIAQHFSHHLHRYDDIQRGVMKADIARVARLFVDGGLYLDTDYKLIHGLDPAMLDHGCILPIERGSAHVSGGETRFSGDFRLGNAFLAAEAGHPMLLGFIDHIFSQVSSRAMSEIELMKISGPHGLTSFYRSNHHRFDAVWLAPRDVFLPALTFGGLSFARSPETRGAHLCWGSWRNKRTSHDIRNRTRRLLSAI